MSKSKRAQPREVAPIVNWTGVQAQRAQYAPGTIIFGQGDPAPSIMYVEKGGVRLSVLSHSKKEAVVAVLDPGHFFGEGCVRDDFRNWLRLGLRPAKENENPGLDRMSGWGRRDRD